MADSTRISQIKKKIEAANVKLMAVEKEVSKAERKRDRAWSAKADFKEELGEAYLEEWSKVGAPDWSVLLQGSSPGGMVLYRAMEPYLARIGLTLASGAWADTDQYSVAIAMNQGDPTAIGRVARGIRTILPYITPHKSDKAAWFVILTSQSEDCRWELRIKRSGEVSVVKLVWSEIEEDHKCSSIEVALHFIQENLWIESYLNHEEGRLIESQASI